MLSVTLVPGKVFGAGETVDNSKLNLLGAPSVSLSGTASTAQIENASVTPAKLDLTTGFGAFDIYTKRPVFNPRAYTVANIQAKVQAAIDAAIAEGGGTILLDEGDYSLSADAASSGNMPAGYSFLLWAYSATRVQLAFEAKRGARLLNARTGESGLPMAILGVKGALEDVIFDGVTFERTLQERVAHQTIGVLLSENGQGLKRVRFEGAHFRNVSNGILGAAKGLKVRGCWFNYPIGHPNSVAGPGNEAVGVLATTAQGAAEDVLIEGCSLNGCEAGAVNPSASPATVYGAYGLCDVKALGIRIVDNEVKRVSGYGIFVRARPFGETNPSVSEEHEVVISRNKVQFEDITGQTAQTARVGIGCFENNATVAQNRVREAYWGIYVSGGSSAWDSGNDVVTRLQRLKVEGNDVRLAANLKFSDTGIGAANERFGILVEYFRRASVRNNQVEFAGRSAAGLAKYWLAKGISLAVVDDAAVGGNEVYGPADTTSSAADLIWLAGLQFEYCRRVEVGLNFLRNLNIGVIGASDAGSGVTPADVTVDRQGMVDVVWPYAGLTRTDAFAGTLNPTTLHKRVRGGGYRMLRQRTSFLCDAATLGAGFVGGYVRVGSFLNGIFGKVRVWVEGGGGNMTMAAFEVAYWNNGVGSVGSMVQTGFLTQGTLLVDKARVCVNLAPADFICHLDVNVTGLSATSRVWVEVEGVGYNSYEGLWGAPNLPTAMLAGFQGANAVGLKELTFKAGLAIADGTYNGGRLTIGAVEVWDSGTAGRTLHSDPANAADGTAI